MGEKKQLCLTKGKYVDQSDSAIKEQIELQGLSIFSWSDGPGATYSPHQHGHDEVIVVLAGAIQFEIDGQKYMVEEGDELILPKGTIHSAYVPKNSRVNYLICS